MSLPVFPALEFTAFLFDPSLSGDLATLSIKKGRDKMTSGSNKEHSRDDEAIEFNVGASKINCAVLKEALTDWFDPKGILLDTFRRNRDKIEAIASKPISRGRFESDGSILIKTSDC